MMFSNGSMQIALQINQQEKAITYLQIEKNMVKLKYIE